jgi:hypothetical protein
MITIPYNVINIARNAFAGCCALATFAFPDSSALACIAEGVFAECSAKRICSDSHLSAIGARALFDRKELVKKTLLHVQEIAPQAFEKYPLVEIHFPCAMAGSCACCGPQNDGNFNANIAAAHLTLAFPALGRPSSQATAQWYT